MEEASALLLSFFCLYPPLSSYFAYKGYTESGKTQRDIRMVDISVAIADWEGEEENEDDGKKRGPLLTLYFIYVCS